MVDPQAWRDFREQFLDIAERDHGQLWAVDLRGNGDWQLHDGDDDIVREFKNYALAGARALLSDLAPAIGWQRWLSCLRDEPCLSGRVERSHHEPPIERISRVCEVSAEYCRLVAAAAVHPPQSAVAKSERRQAAIPWEHIEIRVLSDHTVQVFRQDKAAESMNFAEMGFGDGRRRGGTPIKSWHLLLKMAEDGRVAAHGSGRPRAQLEKRIQEIRSRLVEAVGGAGDPLRLQSGYYVPVFKLVRSPAADS